MDFGHTVMGPSCGMVLADLGAEVTKIEPAPNGDPTRSLRGFGTGYFGYFNRNKRSIAVNLKTDKGLEIARRMVKTADVLIENFAPGTMERLGLSYAATEAINPRLIYASLKGFLAGPYENRLALDEVVQMMAGLAYMTGPSGRPLRAGTSVVDITGGMFAVIAILVAMRERERTGLGQCVGSALFESTVFLMGQHLCYAAQADGPIPPMPERVSAWAVYDIFTCENGRQIFIGITTDSHWKRFCEVIGWNDLGSDKTLASNNQRVSERPRLMRKFMDMAMTMTVEALTEVCEKARVPFAPITKPEDLFSDPHLEATGGLLATELPNGTHVGLPRLPIFMKGADFRVRRDPPVIGQDTIGVLNEVGFSEAEITALLEEDVVRAGTRNTNADQS